MTSHEMRNPLSAIVQSADGIISALHDFRSQATGLRVVNPTLDETLESAIDAAQTIVLCADYQKRIVDDILTLSKLDSELLLVTPENVEIRPLLKNLLRMFESQLKAADISLEFKVEASLADLNGERLFIDPARFSQVVINLLTNSIKFTQPEARRAIKVTLEASLKNPSQTASHLRYIPRRDSAKDMTLKAGWGTGDILYLLVFVEDTGRGLSPEETQLLFMRFSQGQCRVKH